MPLKKSIRKGKPRKKRDEAFKRMTKSVYDIGKPLAERLYKASKPMIKSTMSDMYDHTSKHARDFLEGKRVPKVANNPSWVDLKDPLNEKLHDLGHGEIDVSIYMRGVEAFLNKYKGISFSKAEIKQAKYTVMGKDVGSAMEQYVETAVKKGITVEVMVEIFEYLFNHKLSLDDDTEIDEDESDGGFTEVKEKKRLEALKKKMRKLEMKADTTSRLLMTMNKKPEIVSWTSVLNDAIREIANHIADEAEDYDLVTEVKEKYTALIKRHQNKGHNVIDPFAAKSKKKKKKKKKKKQNTKKRKKSKK
jgi:hypothetical protein